MLPLLALIIVSVCWIEVRIVVVALEQRRGVFPAQPEIQRQLWRDAKIVLRVERIDVLAEIDHSVVSQIDHARECQR